MQFPEIWAMFYSGLVSFQYHPGCKERMPLVELAAIADAMYDQFLLRRSVWHG